ncbi:hypothetical protein SEABISCUIT_76 [Mycobacterium phage Seabiscuit]|uniref:endonuclease VII n=1 Tax=Mycobacterium phage Seabiscuit TaxID=1458714 RepID=UPI00043AD133|nr:endonuclease VII [Mycobacterium phage Seabiscuit]AHN84394.1 hypothetical protein SEABISCUIT_76 [Mycobacterium phage Seabiscuit]
MKTCNRCWETKPLSEYHRNKKAKDGLLDQCKECKLAYMAKYHEDNRLELNVKQRLYYERNRDKVVAKQREYAQAHRAEKGAYDRAYKDSRRQSDPLAFRIYAGRKRARLAGASVEDFDSLDLELYWLCNGISAARCYYTGELLGPDFHLDHKTPLSRGGAHTLDNLVPCSPFANVGKKDRTEPEYREFLRARARQAR